MKNTNSKEVKCTIPLNRDNEEQGILLGYDGNGYTQKLSYKNGMYQVQVFDKLYFKDQGRDFVWVPCEWSDIKYGDIGYMEDIPKKWPLEMQRTNQCFIKTSDDSFRYSFCDEILNYIFDHTPPDLNFYKLEER